MVEDGGEEYPIFTQTEKEKQVAAINLHRRSTPATAITGFQLKRTVS